MTSTEVNGPGKRFVLWLQGCLLRCPGCLNPEFQDFQAGSRMSFIEIQDLILRAGRLEGVTFSGGEPMLQAEALLPLARWIKKQGLGLVSYSGYTLDELTGTEALPGVQDLLAELDILIDGPFVQAEKAPLLWRGSRNQQVRFLTDRYRSFQDAVLRTGHSQAEISFNGGKLALTGFFPPEIWQMLQDRINQ